MKKKRLLILYTGNGKGKTTAALGQAMRAVGHGFKVCIIQFIKSNTRTGEANALALLGDDVELHVMGSGFTWEEKDEEKLRQTSLIAWEFAREKITGGSYDMIILDELTYLLSYGLVDSDEVLATLKNRPENLHVVVTGRDAPQGLIDAADLVTRMEEVKHPYKEGVKAQKGIEF